MRLALRIDSRSCYINPSSPPPPPALLVPTAALLLSSPSLLEKLGRVEPSSGQTTGAEKLLLAVTHGNRRETTEALLS